MARNQKMDRYGPLISEDEMSFCCLWCLWYITVPQCSSVQKLQKKMLLLFLVDYHSTGSAESHECATLSYCAMQTLTQHRGRLNEQMYRIMRRSWTIFSSGCVKCKMFIRSHRWSMGLIKLYCRRLETYKKSAAWQLSLRFDGKHKMCVEQEIVN